LLLHDRTLDAYRALERLLAEGKVRAIGVSNFMPEHLERLLAETSVVPATISVRPSAANTGRPLAATRSAHRSSKSTVPQVGRR
jgi:diketogulonate reductase-like aldo/keto reductase